MPQKFSAFSAGTLIKDTGATYHGVPVTRKVADQNREDITSPITDKIIKIARVSEGGI